MVKISDLSNADIGNEQNVVYLITSTNGVHYVGITTNTLKNRMSEHHSAIRVDHGDGEKFIHYYNQPGNDFEDADIQIIDRGTNRKELLQKERHWIKHYDSIRNGLNSEL
jgi:predicted GIY-YIG superfamily endonuclease